MTPVVPHVMAKPPQQLRMVVDSRHRCQGIGSALTKRVIDFEERNKARKV